MIWAIGAALHARRNDKERAEHSAKWSYKICTDTKALRNDTDLSSCDAERAKTRALWMEGSLMGVLLVALGPLPFFWLSAFILLYFYRAQVVGFRAVVPWAELLVARKTFVVFCVLFSAAVLSTGAIFVMSLYVDTQVPVSMSTFLDVIQSGDGFVSASGTWTRTDLNGVDDSIASPLQTSKINCNKKERRCTKALASVSGNTLMTDVVDYDIQSWTSNAIVMRRDYPCSVELFTIDLNTRSVSGAGHRTNDNQPLCKTSKTAKADWTYQLAKGFDVYWNLRQKARPVPLRIIQSFFGN